MEVGENSQRLRQGEVGLLGAVMTGAAIMAPSASILFGVAVVAGIAGSAVPLIFVIAALGVLATGNSLARFARQWPSAGSFVTFITRVFGPTAGLWIGVAAMLGWLIAYAAVFLFIGDFIANDFFGGATSDLATSLCMVGFVAVVLALVIRGVSVSVRVSLVALAIEVLVIGIICAAVLIDGGPKGVSLHPFAFPSGGFEPVALGFAVTVFLFGGFEQPVPLAEETRHPRRDVPLAVLLCVVAIGALYVLASWALVIAFGDGAGLAQQADPLHAAADAYVGWLAPVVKWVLLASFLGFGVAAITAVSRILFNTARDGLLPPALGGLHPRYRTPAAAAGAFAGLGLVIALASKPITDTLTAVTLLSTAGSLLIISMYVLINAALIVWWWRERGVGRHHDPLTCVVVPAAGIAVLASPYYYNLKPGQASPLDLVPWVLAGAVVVSVAYVAWVRGARPAQLADAGRILAGETETVVAAAPTVGGMPAGVGTI
jgi:amino acid transporter